ncbi:hypothetical protein HOF78_02110 [Candidatus Woesearchaeota archaeon]|jgi:hypothetical protein|nr:hypothetical protein [Candidatus Woesearchaeota archaeon]MBT6401941.1 hypothetical protein [Candidatus Woesearchaeota archaeon]
MKKKTERPRILCREFEFESGVMLDTIRAAVRNLQMPSVRGTNIEMNLLEEGEFSTILGEPNPIFRGPYCSHEHPIKDGLRKFYELVFTRDESISRIFVPVSCAKAIERATTYR